MMAASVSPGSDRVYPALAGSPAALALSVPGIHIDSIVEAVGPEAL